MTMVAPVLKLDDAKEELRVAHRDMDAHIARTNDWAVAKVERDAQITLRPAVTRRLSIPDFPNWRGGGFTTDEHVASRVWPPRRYKIPHLIPLGYPPVSDVLTVTYYDEANVQQTVAATNYRMVQRDRASSILEFDENYTFPSVKNRLDAVQITFVTGTTQPDEVGLMAASLYRDYFVDRSKELLDEYKNLIHSLRVHSHGFVGITKDLGLPGIDPAATTAHFREETYAISRTNSIKGIPPTYAEINAWQNPFDSNNQTYADAVLPLIKGANTFLRLGDGTLEQWELTALSPETWTKVGETDVLALSGGGGTGGEDLQETTDIGNVTTNSMEYLSNLVGTIFQAKDTGERWIEGTTALGETIRIKLS